MSGPHQKLPASNVTCRYWATSGTCFFGDQCNFAHNVADRATSGRAVPKREKACKELLLTGYCKNEDKGCEYNHDIAGVTRSGPPASTVSGISSSTTSNTWTASASRASGAPGTAPVAGIRNKGLPVSAPAFVPAAVAAAQRAALSAWGGVTPGGGKLLNSVNPQAPFISVSSTGSGTQSQNGTPITTSSPAVDPSSAAAQISPQRTSEIESDNSGSSPVQSLSSPASLPARLNTQPTNSSVSAGSVNGGSSASSSIGNANAAPYVPAAVASAVGAPPYVPKAKQQQLGGNGGFPAPMGTGLGFNGGGTRPLPMGHPHVSGPTQQLQIRQQLSQLQQQMQQQAAVHMIAAARGMSGNGISSPYLNLDAPIGMAPFRLPDGDDPALGMTAMSPPNPPFVIPLSRTGNGGLPMLPSQEALANMGLVGDGIGGLQMGNGFASQLSFGPSVQSQSLRSHQQQQTMHQLQKMHMQHHAHLQQQPKLVPPFSLRSPQKLDGQQQFGQTQEKPASVSAPADGGAANDARSMFSGESQQKDRAGSTSELDQQHQSLNEQSAIQQQQQQQQPQLQLHSQHQHQHPQQIPASPQPQPGLKQQQRQLQKLPHHQQIQILQQRPQTPQGASPAVRLPSGYFRSMSPVSNLTTVAAATHGGATYFLGPGQGINSLHHVVSSGPFSGSGVRAEGRVARGPSPVGRAQLGSKFLPENLREELRRRHALIHAQLDPEQDLVDLPEMVQRFHSLYPLEDMNREDDSPSSSFGVRTMIFKGVSSSDGQAYAIRRIDSRQVIPTAELVTAAAEAVERWAPLSRHPHIVAIREAFVSREVEDSTALFFVHDYYPGAVTLEAFHFHQEQPGGVVHLTVSEDQIWSYMVQIATVIRAVHAAGLYFRPGGLQPSKILIPSKGRLRVNGVGILDVLNGDPADDLHVLQREDLAGFGRLVLSMACGSAVNFSLDFMAAHYSQELVRITQGLLASSLEKSEGISIHQFYGALAERTYSEIEQLHIQSDELMTELSKETENGRLLRILIKLGMMNERPDNDMDPNWSEIGDRYLLKLFRDFVFHQVTDDGTPVLDWGHVIESLNKLDAGVSEKLILLSRDERSMLIASYADLKRCLEGAYQELVARASGDKPRVSLAQSALSVAQSHMGHAPRMSQRQGS